MSDEAAQTERWTSLTDDDLTDPELGQLEAILGAVIEYGAGKVTGSGRNQYGEITFCTTVANIDGQATGVVIRPSVNEDGDQLDVLVAVGPSIEDPDAAARSEGGS